ncbi:catalase [Kaistella flava (ex Peng et al. 2021)]|uniref:Catalase n=1 Tax=Kaistella flava (ex Peng et al. 2021) TaxID=2038776 RepID=A0A7M2Y725_9FLAO|nr:catalase [Kaistella flava (ex Peng et al. 2021)]QOW09609.1 catalase [Kaistella flava (ex Peng et al. 2021)]
MKSLLQYSSDLDQLSAAENSDLAKAVKSVEQFIKSSSKISKVNHATRDAHSKTYATVKARLTISEDLPEFITDIFDQKEYELLARFSNGNLVINKKGRDTPLYGFSLKIKKVKGQDANFPLVNFPLFPTNSPSIFLNFFRSVNTFLVTKQDNFLVSVLDLPSLIKNSLSLFISMFSVDVLKKIIKFIPKRKDFFFSFNYDGIGCYRLGNYIMKIGLKPVRNLSGIGENESQQESITEFISLQDSNFLLTIQLCENLENQPVNDLMKTWKNAPEYCLGKIVIPQDSLLDSNDPEIENLNFNPFENAENLQPVGKIQQIRKQIYEASIATRNKLNVNKSN